MPSTFIDCLIFIRERDDLTPVQDETLAALSIDPTHAFGRMECDFEGRDTVVTRIRMVHVQAIAKYLNSINGDTGTSVQEVEALESSTPP